MSLTIAPELLSASPWRAGSGVSLASLTPGHDEVGMLAGVPSVLISLPWDVRLRVHDGELHEQHAGPERQPHRHHRPGGGTRLQHISGFPDSEAPGGPHSHSFRRQHCPYGIAQTLPQCQSVEQPAGRLFQALVPESAYACTGSISVHTRLHNCIRHAVEQSRTAHTMVRLSDVCNARVFSYGRACREGGRFEAKRAAPERQEL